MPGYGAVDRYGVQRTLAVGWEGSDYAASHSYQAMMDAPGGHAVCCAPGRGRRAVLVGADEVKQSFRHNCVPKYRNELKDVTRERPLIPSKWLSGSVRNQFLRTVFKRVQKGGVEHTRTMVQNHLKGIYSKDI